MGVVVVLALLLVAVQVLYNLYTVSVVSAAGFDAARLVAGGDGAVGEDEAEDHARRLLGRYGERVRFDWSGSDDDAVRLRVRADNPSLLLPALRTSLPFSRIDRTVRVRVERFR